MPGLYSITTRSTGELIDAVKYNADHQNHVDNQTPTGTDDYSANLGQMRSTTDPGEEATESMPTSLAGEIERIRFILKEIIGGAQWYTSPPLNLNNLSVAGVNLSNLWIAGETATENVVANTVAESSLFSVTIPGGTIGANGILQGSAGIFVTSMLHTATLQIMVRLGGVVVYSPVIINVTTSTQTNFGIYTTFRLHNRNNESSQALAFTTTLPANVNNLLRFNFTGASNVNSQIGTSTADTTADQLFQVNVIWGTASASNSCAAMGLDLYRTK